MSVKIHMQGNETFHIQQMKGHSSLTLACFLHSIPMTQYYHAKIPLNFFSGLPVPLFPRQQVIQINHYLCISIQYCHLSLISCVRTDAKLLVCTSVCTSQSMAGKAATLINVHAAWRKWVSLASCFSHQPTS